MIKSRKLSWDARIILELNKGNVWTPPELMREICCPKATFYDSLNVLRITKKINDYKKDKKLYSLVISPDKIKIKKALIECLKQEADELDEYDEKIIDVFYEPNLLQCLRDEDFTTKVALRCGLSPDKDFMKELYAVANEIMIHKGIQTEEKFTPEQRKVLKKKYEEMGMKIKFMNE